MAYKWTANENNTVTMREEYYICRVIALPTKTRDLAGLLEDAYNLGRKTKLTEIKEALEIKEKKE